MKLTQPMVWLHLDTTSRTSLLKTCPARFTTVFCDHVTLKFDEPLTDAEQIIVGKTFTITAYELCWSSDIQAVRVDTPNLPDQYGAPHITISAADGVEPFTSVAMLKSAHEKLALNDLKLSGTVRLVY